MISYHSYGEIFPICMRKMFIWENVSLARQDPSSIQPRSQLIRKTGFHVNAFVMSCGLGMWSEISADQNSCFTGKMPGKLSPYEQALRPFSISTTFPSPFIHPIHNSLCYILDITMCQWRVSHRNATYRKQISLTYVPIMLWPTWNSQYQLLHMLLKQVNQHPVHHQNTKLKYCNN